MVQCEPRNGAIGALDRMEIAQAPRMWSVQGRRLRVGITSIILDPIQSAHVDDEAVKNSLERQMAAFDNSKAASSSTPWSNIVQKKTQVPESEPFKTKHKCRTPDRSKKNTRQWKCGVRRILVRTGRRAPASRHPKSDRREPRGAKRMRSAHLSRHLRWFHCRCGLCKWAQMNGI